MTNLNDSGHDGLGLEVAGQELSMLLDSWGARNALG
jgi:hypothetical protein